jgi:arabinan endo-1,5-alpha-L-arabinosidase
MRASMQFSHEMVAIAFATLASSLPGCGSNVPDRPDSSSGGPPVEAGVPALDGAQGAPLEVATSDAGAHANVPDASGALVHDSGPGGVDAAIADADASAESGATGAACGNAPLGGGPVTTTTTHLDIGVHDPSMIWDGTHYDLFATGGTLAIRQSTDLITWTNAGSVFTAVPGWFADAGVAPQDLWAPDISYYNGKFHVYYAGSTFGSNASAIGLATTPTLSSRSTWTDQGMVLRSSTSDDFNAIDPNVSFDENCTPWLAFGSFWSGIKLRKLDASTGLLATDGTTTYSLASRNGGGGAIEAASIVSHNGYYYLFVSFDLCCKGTSSTYRTMVGRGSQITGPYTDKAGHDMMTGAAEELLASDGRYIGPGGGTAWKDGSVYLYAYHYYDGDDNGASKLQIRPIDFDSDDWVVLGTPLFP